MAEFSFHFSLTSLLCPVACFHIFTPSLLIRPQVYPILILMDFKTNMTLNISFLPMCPFLYLESSPYLWTISRIPDPTGCLPLVFYTLLIDLLLITIIVWSVITLILPLPSLTLTYIHLNLQHTDHQKPITLLLSNQLTSIALLVTAVLVLPCKA